GSHVLPAAALERTNAAIFGVRHEVDKLAAHLAELDRRRFFKRLRGVESAQINKLECRFDVFSILCAKAGTAQSDHVESKDRIAFSCDDERRQILSERGAALHHHQSSDVHELVKRRAAAKKRAIIDPNVTGKQTAVSDNDIIPNLAIMTDVCAGHQKIFITDFCGAALGGGAMNGAVFADDVVFPNLDLRFSLGRKRYILWRRTDDRAVSDKISRADRNFSFNDDVRLHDRFVADRHLRSNYRKRPDLGARADFRAR